MHVYIISDLLNCVKPGLREVGVRCASPFLFPGSNRKLYTSGGSHETSERWKSTRMFMI